MKEQRPEGKTARPDRLRVGAVLNGGLALIAVGLGATAYDMVVASGAAAFVIGPVAWLFAAYHGAFHTHITRDEFRVVPIAAVAAFGAVLAWVAVGTATGLTAFGVSDALALAFVTTVSLLAGLVAGRFVLRQWWRRGEFRSTVVVAGVGTVTSELALELSHRADLGIDVVEQIDLASEETNSVEEALRRHKPDRLVLGEVGMHEHSLLPAMRFAGTIGTRVYVLPRLFSMGIGNPLFSPDQLRGFPLQRVNRPAHPQLAFALKRAMDIAVSASVLLGLAPLLLVVAFLTKVTSPGPILFWQERLGRNGELIRIPKFRSMSVSDSDEWVADARITRFGRYLRRSALDEIPQLWSVLRGDMSLVGPRPERPAYASKFAEVHGYESRLRMRMGLTGLAQIAGLRGDTSIAERAKYDNLYIDQWSLAGDVMILLRTVGAIVGERRRGQAQLDLEAALSTLTADVSPIDVRSVASPEPHTDKTEPNDNDQLNGTKRNDTELMAQGRPSNA